MGKHLRRLTEKSRAIKSNAILGRQLTQISYIHLYICTYKNTLASFSYISVAWMHRNVIVRSDQLPSTWWSPTLIKHRWTRGLAQLHSSRGARCLRYARHIMLLIFLECLMQIRVALILATSLICGCILLLDRGGGFGLLFINWTSLSLFFSLFFFFFSPGNIQSAREPGQAGSHAARDCDSNHGEDNIHPRRFNWLI